MPIYRSFVGCRLPAFTVTVDPDRMDGAVVLALTASSAEGRVYIEGTATLALAERS